MVQVYSDPSRMNDAYSLPDTEVFFIAEGEETDYADSDENVLCAGWYWQSCFPGCMPDSEPMGPYETEMEAIEAAQDID